MAKKRSAEQWARLKPDYRKRLERKGISRSDYLAGANLQSARGQAKEAVRTQTRQALGLPGQSTIREWRARAARRGITRSDWDAAVREAGPSRFLAVKDAVRSVEARHRAWVDAGSPRRYKTKVDTREDRAKPRPNIPPLIVPPHEYVYDEQDDTYYPPDYVSSHEDQFYDIGDLLYEEYEPDPAIEWGESWGYYH